MTRLYTSEFRCGVCFRISVTGWVYRCTQDRELLIEEDIERDEVDKIDVLCDLFPPTSNPRKRGPAARASRLSFLDEISHDAMKTYTPAQLSIILNQRAHVLDVAEEISAYYAKDASHTYSNSDKSTSALVSQTLIPPKAPIEPYQKPWLPFKGTECQFKCCHVCRPTLTERAFLSLDAIVNNDIPPTAIYGFGFHLHTRRRPVALVEHVKNLGLRPSPPPGPENSIMRPEDRQFYLSTHQPRAGLGILDPTIPERPLPSIPTHEDHAHSAQASLFAAEISPITGRSTQAKPYMIPARSTLLLRLDSAHSNVAVLTPLPDQTDDEVDRLTPMEMGERQCGFEEQLSEVTFGMAITDEDVGLHVADLISQS